MPLSHLVHNDEAKFPRSGTQCVLATDERIKENRTMANKLKIDDEKILILDSYGGTFARVYFSDHEQRQHALMAADKISQLQRILEKQ